MENNTGHIDPFWDITQVKSVDYKLDYHKDVELVQQYVSAGHSEQHIKLWNYFEPNPMPADISLFKNLFPNLDYMSVAINKFTPGQYLPLHKDLYGRYRQVHNIKDINSIVRIIVMIEDSRPGQIVQVGDQSWAKWQAGDWFSWVGAEPHAFYNLSFEDRYAWQITGVKQ